MRLFFCGGCLLLMMACVRHPSRMPGKTGRDNAELLKPVVAVADFENRASFRGKWNIGDGFADVLVTRMIETGDVVVLDRQHLEALLDEIKLQRSGAFRDEGRSEYGRLKNVEYLVTGVITEFTVTGDSSGWFRKRDLRIEGGSSKARVAMNIKISEVESGQVIASLESSGKVRSGRFGASFRYQDMSFGGEVFSRSPLGKATNEAMDKALKEILRELPDKEWEPRVAEVQGAQLVINGGKNVGLKAGRLLELRGEVREIRDPVTGNVIDQVAGAVLGKVEVVEVGKLSSRATLLEGTAERGMLLSPVSE